MYLSNKDWIPGRRVKRYTENLGYHLDVEWSPPSNTDTDAPTATEQAIESLLTRLIESARERGCDAIASVEVIVEVRGSTVRYAVHGVPAETSPWGGSYPNPYSSQ